MKAFGHIFLQAFKTLFPLALNRVGKIGVRIGYSGGRQRRSAIWGGGCNTPLAADEPPDGK